VSTVLVTGGSGFIGSHCLGTLVAHGLDVHAVRAGRPGIEADGVTWHTADLLEEPDIARLVEAVRPRYLLHLAWVATPGVFPSSVENFRWTQASLSLYRAFAESGGRRVVTAGTSYEYDWRYGYCSEAVTPLVPDSVYGTCKKALSDLVAVLAERHGLSNAWARVFFLYGPREYRERLVSSVILNLLRGTPAKCSHGEQIRDYLHVQDVADAFVSILLSDVTGPVNIGSGSAVTLKSIVKAIGEKLQRPELVELGAIPARENDAPLVVADVGRLTAEVGWRPAIPLDEGLDRTIEWWRAETAAGR
jgi:nucleoside-diphosphate-sugar epimerase